MKKTVLLLIVLSASISTISASEVTQFQASKVALRFIAEKSMVAREASTISYSVKETLVIGEFEAPFYYVFNLEPQGWIIISADDAVPPVLAYSFEGSYSTTNAPVQCNAWMKQYEDQIRYARKNNFPAYSYVATLWSDLLVPRNSSFVIHNSKSVAPLITSNWNQNYPYNAMCPSDPAGPGGHAYAGCVPTCMGQVMYYFRWPWTGTGSYSYVDSTYGTLTANFDTTHYDWNRMTDISNGVNPAIAQLLYHLGVSCDLVYGPGGSGMYNHKAAYSLRTFFKYSPQTQYVFRDSTTMDWDSLLISHLDRKIPMYYAGWSLPNVNGHAFVCDGYQDSCYFHFNFGWSGQNNGYFYTSDLTPGGNNFNLAQEVIINCYPDTVNYTYPVYCSGSSEIKFQEGTFDDGSGPVQAYLSNSSCSWLINPQTEKDSITSITLNFKRFETNPDDLVNVYDGATLSDPLLASFSGDSIPSAVSSYGNKMLVTFTSSTATPAQGFLAGFTTEVPVWCAGTTEINGDTAEFSDGSFGFDYHNGQLCKWKVTRTSGGPLTLYFRSFDTEEGKDFLKIYDFSTSEVVAQLSGHYDPDTLPLPVTIESGTAFLIFTSNSSVAGEGWEIYYPKSTEGIGELQDQTSLRIFPNPASDVVTVSIGAEHTGTGQIDILTVEGKIVRTMNVLVTPGCNMHKIDVTDFQPGIYLLQFRNNSVNYTRKLVVI
jgi:hypothetical protein